MRSKSPSTPASRSDRRATTLAGACERRVDARVAQRLVVDVDGDDFGVGPARGRRAPRRARHRSRCRPRVAPARRRRDGARSRRESIGVGPEEDGVALGRGVRRMEEQRVVEGRRADRRTPAVAVLAQRAARLHQLAPASAGSTPARNGRLQPNTSSTERAHSVCRARIDARMGGGRCGREAIAACLQGAAEPQQAVVLRGKVGRRRSSADQAGADARGEQSGGRRSGSPATGSLAARRSPRPSRRRPASRSAMTRTSSSARSAADRSAS